MNLEGADALLSPHMQAETLLADKPSMARQRGYRTSAGGRKTFSYPPRAIEGGPAQTFCREMYKARHLMETFSSSASFKHYRAIAIATTASQNFPRGSTRRRIVCPMRTGHNTNGQRRKNNDPSCLAMRYLTVTIQDSGMWIRWVNFGFF